MARTSKTEQELGFLRSFWEWVDDIERELDMRVHVALIPTTVRGVWNIRLDATTKETDLLGEALGQCAFMKRFPNGDNTTLAGELFSAAMKLRPMAEQQRSKVARPKKKG